MFPENVTALKIALLFFIPGMTSLEVQRFFVPAHFRTDFELGARALVYGSINYLVYFSCHGNAFGAESSPSLRKLLTFFVIAPLVQGVFWGVASKQNLIFKALTWLLNTRFSLSLFPAGMILSSGYGEVWDRIFDSPKKQWVWVHTKTGKIYEGLTGRISNYPHEKQLYIDGAISAIESPKRALPNCKGILFRADEISHIELFK